MFHLKVFIEDRILNLKDAFISGKGITVHIKQLFITMEWRGKRGYGASLLPNTQMKLWNTSELEKQLNDYLIGKTPYEMQSILNANGSKLWPDFLHIAIDIALHDLISKIANLPLYKLWGLDQLEIPTTSLSIGALQEESLLEKVSQYSNWPILKFKITSWNDLHIFQRVREIYQGRIWIDGNGALNYKDAIRAVEFLDSIGVELLEQPIPPGDYKRLKDLKERTNLKIVADEDCVDLHDVIQLAGCVDVVNIKLYKCKGLTKARTMMEVARSLGLKIMLGCKTESVLGITAIAQLSGLADYVDFDGHLDILDDRFEGLNVKNGVYQLPDRPGIGAILRY